MTRRPRSVSRRLLVGVAVVSAAAASTVACTSTPTTTTATPGTTPSATSRFLDANNAKLDGVWTSEGRRYMGIDGKRGTGTEVLTITGQKDGLFQTSREIKVDQPVDFGEGDLQTAATVKSIGVVNPDGTISIVKLGDNGRIEGWLIDQDHMELTYTEGAEEPFVVRETLVRQKS